jgi:predicted RNase H-like nuclease (RuvC/YqgF family)
VIIPDTIPTQALETLKNNNIPIIPLENINLTFLNEFAIISLKEINDEIKIYELELQKQRVNEEKEQILKAFDEYKAKRKREL